MYEKEMMVAKDKMEIKNMIREYNNRAIAMKKPEIALGLKMI